jgi:hypothetical protein
MKNQSNTLPPLRPGLRNIITCASTSTTKRIIFYSIPNWPQQPAEWHVSAHKRHHHVMKHTHTVLSDAKDDIVRTLLTNRESATPPAERIRVTSLVELTSQATSTSFCNELLYITHSAQQVHYIYLILPTATELSPIHLDIHFKVVALPTHHV